MKISIEYDSIVKKKVQITKNVLKKLFLTDKLSEHKILSTAQNTNVVTLFPKL